MGETRGRWVGWITVLCTLAGWSSIPLFLRYFTKEIDAWTANGWRYGVSAVIWMVPLLIAHQRGALPAGLWRAALWPSLWNIPAQAMFALAPYYVEPGLMTFSLRVHIVFLAVGAAILFAAERRVVRSPGFLLGVGLTLAGTMATIAFKPGGLGDGSALGVAVCVGAGLLYAFYALAVRRSMMNINPVTAFASVNQITALGLLALMLAFGRNVSTGDWDGGASALAIGGTKFALLVLSAVIGIGLGHTFYFLSIGRLGLAVSAAVVQLQPVVVSIASFFIFGERLTLWQWIGGFIALAGAGIVLYTQHAMSQKVRETVREEALAGA
jgi:drug/metabolite transporter (DMT)-like permease